MRITVDCFLLAYCAFVNAIVIAGDPDPATAEKIGVLLDFADTQFEREDFAHALAAYTEVLKLDPDNLLALNGRGQARAATDDIKGALSDFDTLVKIDRKNPAAWTNRGAVYLQASKYDAAIKDFTAAIKIDPKFSKAYRARAFAYQQTKQDALAAADTKQAEQLEVFEDMERRLREKFGKGKEVLDPTSDK